MYRIFLSLCSFIIFILLSLSSTHAAEHSVSTNAELIKTLAKAQGGDTIRLNSGDYGDIVIYGKNYSKKVTISGDGKNTILGQTKIVRSSNLAFENIIFSRDMGASDKNYTPIVTVSYSTNIDITHNIITSSDDNNTSNDLTGISSGGNTNLEISNNSFSNLYKGFTGNSSNTVIINENNFDIISKVGVELGRNSLNSEVTNNNFENFYPCNTESAKTCTSPGTIISLWNNGGNQNLDNTQVTGNISLIGKGSFGQFIIARSNNTTYPITNLVVANNSLYNNHINGIYLDGVYTAEVENNSLIQGNFSAFNLSDNSKKPYIRIHNSSKISIKKNVAFGIQKKSNSKISESQNIVAQRLDTSKKTHISKLIFQDNLGEETVLGSLAPQDGSLLDLGNNTYIGSQSHYEQKKITRTPIEYNVASNSEFVAALNKVQGGDAIILANGNYGDILIYGKLFDEGIKIQAKNTRKAIIEKLQITASSNIHLQGIVFEHERRDDEYDWSKVVYLNQSSNISIHHSEFIGSDDGVSTNDIEGFGTRSSNNIHLSNNEFSNLEKGAVFDDTHSVIFDNNNLHNIAVDGVAFGNNASHIDITNNSFTNFKPCDIFDTATCKKHPDFIQFWNNNGTSHNEDILIKDNSLIRGEGGVTQGILIQANNATYTNKDFLIEGNTIDTNHIHGITVVDGEDITIDNNTITTSETEIVTTQSTNKWTTNPRIRFYNISSGTITNNTTNLIDLINSDDAVLEGNVESMR